METKHTVEHWHIAKYGNVKNKDSGHIGIRVNGFALSSGAEAEANAPGAIMAGHKQEG